MKKKIFYRRGSEGPKFDPYGFDEWTICIGKKEITLHRGLGVYLSINGEVMMQDQGKDSFSADMLEINPDIRWGYKDVVREFEKLAGITLDELERDHNPYNEPEKCPECGSMEFEESSGMGGEPMTLCSKCHGVVWSHPDPLRFCE